MFNGQQLQAKLRRQIDRELDAGEVLRWFEQPLPRFFTPQSVAHFLSGILFTGFAVFWMYNAVGSEIPDLREGIKIDHIFALWGIPFVLVGFWMLVSPLREWLKAFRTVYLITNKRAISIESGWVITIRNYRPAQLKNLYRKERRDGTGDVVITTRIRKGNNNNSWTEEIGFMNVRNPKEVERLLQQLAQTEA